ncbi:MAG: uracil-DNA glycosylase family protein [Pseudomonadota bacterium]
MGLQHKIKTCRLCEARFAETHTQHAPRPVAWFQPGARLLIAGQAPGMRVHMSGRPFDDPSGDRLRDWLGLSWDEFYDTARVAFVPMAFCFPGYDAKGSDLPPPKLCGETWHDQVMEALHSVRLRVLVGGYAHKYHLGLRSSVTETVKAWREHVPEVFPLPHPSWRNTAWLKKNPWFEAELLPVLRARVHEVMHG